MKDTHTHRGHCQYCLRVMAIDVTTGKLAKHGYTVEGGMFQGQCPGSEVLSLHMDRSHTDDVIAMYRKSAASSRAEADSIESGATHPDTCLGGRPWYSDDVKNGESLARSWETKYHKVKVQKIDKRTMQPRDVEVEEPVRVQWEEATAHERMREVYVTVECLRREAKSADRFADTMTKWAKDIHDGRVPAYRVEDIDDWCKVGVTVRAGGEKKPFESVVHEIKIETYRSFGFSRGSNEISAPYARITVPGTPAVMTKDGKRVKKPAKPAEDIWQAVRTLKPLEGSLIARLKADNLI